MSNKYRKSGLEKTYSSFTDNPEFRKDEQVRRDLDDVKAFEVSLYDIDEAFKFFLTDIVKPFVIEGKERIQVPVQYANSETWSSVQKHGYLRDKKNKLFTPLIVFKKTALSKLDGLAKSALLKNREENRILYSTKYNRKNSYDQFSKLNNIHPVKEFYSVSVPDFVSIPYEIIIWTEYNEQLNKIVEQLHYHSGGSYGKKYKFKIIIDDYSFETLNNVGEERIVRCNISAHANAYIVIKETSTKVNMNKSFSIRNVVIDEEVVNDISEVRDKIVENKDKLFTTKTKDKNFIQ